jgi:glycosyltransferase involved in cell wall biosynthesis
VKILLASDTFAPDVNGAARFTERLGAALAERGHDVHAVAPSPTGTAYTEVYNGIVVHRIASREYPLAKGFFVCMPWTARGALKRLFAELRPDVVHAQNHYVIGRYACAMARRFNIGLVATNHFMPENLVEHAKIPQFLRDIVCDLAYKDVGRVFRSAKILTAPTPRAVELYSSRTGAKNMVAVSNGIDPAPYEAAARASAPNEVPVILFAGRLDQEKRVNELIAAVAKLPPSVPYRLDIIGNGSHREVWTRQATDLGLVPGKVRFLGFVDESDLIAAYGQCDVFCIPGVAELQSLVTLEAMAAGKPVVGANAMALPHLIHPGENGWLYEPEDVDELRDRLADLLRDPAKRLRFGERGHEIVVSQHSWDATLRAFERFYTTVAH